MKARVPASLAGRLHAYSVRQQEEEEEDQQQQGGLARQEEEEEEEEEEEGADVALKAPARGDVSGWGSEESEWAAFPVPVSPPSVAKAPA